MITDAFSRLLHSGWGAIVLSLLLPALASAATIRVTTTADELFDNRQCSLREALLAANTDTRVDTCKKGRGRDRILLPAGTFEIFDTLTVTSPLVIQGAGAEKTVLRPAPDTSHLRGPLVEVDYSAPRMAFARLRLLTICCAGTPELPRDVLTLRGYARVGIDRVTVRDTVPLGRALIVFDQAEARINGSTFERNDAPVDPDGGNGGAIYNAGRLFLTRARLRDNTSWVPGVAVHNRPSGHLRSDGSVFEDNVKLSPPVSNGGGGAIFNLHGSAVLWRSTVQQNIAATAGAIWNAGGHLELIQTLIIDNEAFVPGGTGGLLNGGDVDDVGRLLRPTLEVRHSTIVENMVDGQRGVSGADCQMATFPPDVWERNTILSGDACLGAPASASGAM